MKTVRWCKWKIHRNVFPLILCRASPACNACNPCLNAFQMRFKVTYCSLSPAREQDTTENNTITEGNITRGGTALHRALRDVWGSCTTANCVVMGLFVLRVWIVFTASARSLHAHLNVLSAWWRHLFFSASVKARGRRGGWWVAVNSIYRALLPVCE